VSEGSQELPERYQEAVASVGGASLAVLGLLEAAQRRLHPPDLPELVAGQVPARDRLGAALEGFRSLDAPSGLEGFHERMAQGASQALAAVTGFCDPGGSGGDPTLGILRSFRTLCRSFEILYPLRTALPPLARHFVEPAFHADLAALDPDPATGESVGIHRAGPSGDPDARDGFSLYVPERYDGADPWPLVVALHGGFGHGRDFLWTWLREARGRRFLLLAPTSEGTTWSLHAPDRDAARLASMLDFVCERWRVDRARILLTGLSDGATFSLLAGLAENAPYTHLAPVSGVLHPASFSNGNLRRARGRPIHLVHGALDWMFPVSVARMARDALGDCGADLVYREIADLSHAYPREANDAILAWFDPRLALPHADPTPYSGPSATRRR